MPRSTAKPSADAVRPEPTGRPSDPDPRAGAVANDPAAGGAAERPPEGSDASSVFETGADTREERIRRRAYRRAEGRGFAPGHELDDWLAAEAEERDAAPRDARR